MARSKERRINAYFGRTVEEIELWEFLLENYPEDMAAYLKYYARLGMMQVLGEKGLESTKPSANQAKKRTRKKPQQPIQSASPSREKERSVSIPPGDPIPSANDEDPLEDLELNIQEVDPTQKLEQGFNRFIEEEDDEEILELLKLQTSSEHKKSESA